MIKEINNLKIEIIKSDNEIYDRTLNCEKFMKEIDYIAPTWEKMITELKV